MNQCKITAPVCSLEQVGQVLDAGADEVYFSLMTSEWTSRFGNSDFISRRQSEYSHITDLKDLTEIRNIVSKRKASATLVLNSRYTEKQLPYIFEVISEWESVGGDSVMISDLTVLLWLKERNSRLIRHLSLLTGVFNTSSVAFFNRLDVSRIVLPRELTISEIVEIVQHSENNVGFELLCMFQKCEFIDSFCNFYHAFNYSPFLVNDSGELPGKSELPVIETFDINYKGHGCQLRFINQHGRNIKHLLNNDFCTPSCSACQLMLFKKAGIRNFKIAGRGYPVDLIIKGINLIKSSLGTSNNTVDEIRTRYSSIFGQSCGRDYCYYK